MYAIRSYYVKRINCRGSALEACVTRHGTIVGPLMTELVGFPELTPYRGGWCGNEVFGDPGMPYAMYYYLGNTTSYNFV